MEKQDKIAVLIDAENISTKYVKLIMDEVSEYGIATYKRVYGDFSSPGVVSWQDKLREYAMTPVFQFNYTRGKNASDSAIIIDAMDILYSGRVSGFCLVTSDSDFTKLAIRLREAGMTVIGMGEKKTPPSLVAACESFKFLDLLYQENSKNAEENKSKMTVTKQECSRKAPDEPKKEAAEERTRRPNNKIQAEATEENAAELDITVNNIPTKEEVGAEIASIMESRSDEEEWINLSEIGNILLKRIPGFDPRNYNYAKLGKMIKSYDFLEIKTIVNPNDRFLKIVYVRMKQ